MTIKVGDRFKHTKGAIYTALLIKGEYVVMDGLSIAPVVLAASVILDSKWFTPIDEIAVGDKVRYKVRHSGNTHPRGGTVIATHDGKSWVDFSGSMETAPFTYLERVIE